MNIPMQTMHMDMNIQVHQINKKRIFKRDKCIYNRIFKSIKCIAKMNSQYAPYVYSNRKNAYKVISQMHK